MIGFDYGTSNCAVGIMENSQPKLINLGEHGRFMASSLYSPSRDVIVNWLQKNINDPHKEAFTNLRRYQLSLGQEALEDLRYDGIAEHLSFGKQALARYLEDPSEGYYIKSPKSFLGTSGLLPPQIVFFEHIVASMMAHVKQLTENQLQREVNQVVIGRPINFQGRNSEASNKQAIEVLTNAAKHVGYKDVEFQFEPVAAGFEYEATLNKETRVLVVDIGGGTTDCSMLLMGPQFIDKLDRSAELLSHSGKRIGGNDFDIQLALKGIMPNLGITSNLLTGKPMPVNSYHEAVAINDVNAQTEFYSEKNGRFLSQLKRDSQQPELLARLLKVYEQKLSYQLVNSAEQAKINLTDSEQNSVDLSYLDSGLSQSVSRELFLQASENQLNNIAQLMEEAVDAAGCQPDVIFVTGGTAKSPVINQFLQQQFNNIPVVIGDHFGSVASGLTRWSQRIFS
ncbi:molecular chaperone [uncultured Psychrosphaera sp.]|uniref:molecular chaperone n=1 Tax=uncultured Psychrosphaera sp. TaxID=1403522 RepID=UPI002636E86D|nr:molecular chaperone [uncultured Psychrosphaera sp.]